MSAHHHGFAVAVLGVLTTLGIPEPVRAGTNGQNISFRVLGEIDRVKVTGDNENGRPVTWDSVQFEIICNTGRCDQVRTNNWWFKGKIIIEYRLKGDPVPYSCHFYVNERQGGNWVNLFSSGDDAATGRPLANRDPGARCLTSRLDAIVEVQGRAELPAFIRSYLKMVDNGSQAVADIGGRFAGGDARYGDLPGRRLYGAGHFGSTWVVAMEQGGQGGSRLLLHVFEGDKPVREIDAGYDHQAIRVVDGRQVAVVRPFRSIVAKYLFPDSM